MSDGYSVSARTVARRRHRAPEILAALLVGTVGLALAGRLASPPGAREGAPGADPPTLTAAGSAEPVQPTVAAAPALPGSCMYPMGWRLSSVERSPIGWSRVWRAVSPVIAGGPTDPGIDFVRILADEVIGIGWCAPADGPEQPGTTVHAALFRVTEPDASLVGTAPMDGVESGPLGELWRPAGELAGTSWAAGRYAIELAAGDGRWVRWIGLQIEPTAGAAAIAGGVRASPDLP